MPGVTPQTGLVTPTTEIIHASCVTFALGGGVVIIGPTGSGKSGLALELMSRGATLVADDRTCLFLNETQVMANCPPAIRGQIEARGVGILASQTVPAASVRLVVDLGTVEVERLPPMRSAQYLGQPIPLLHNSLSGYFPAMILQYVQGGRVA
jgi:HPr kinase/phosphorylase